LERPQHNLTLGGLKDLVTARTARILLAGSLALFGCARFAPHDMSTARASPDEIAVARLAWTTVTQNEIVAAVVAEPNSIAFAAMSAVGKPTLTPSQVPPSDQHYFPEHYWRVDTVAVFGDSARFVAWQGPIPKPKPGMLLGCGTGHKLWLFRQPDGSWALGPTIGITVC
jgi:hypothetical protein